MTMKPPFLGVGKSVRSLERAGASNGARVAAIDIARGLAIIGMFGAHAIPRANDADLFVDGRPSILFATLAGVSLGIMTGSSRPLARGRRMDRVVGIIIRALILIALGVWLDDFEGTPAVILHYYGMMFLLLIPVLFLSRWMLALLAAVLAFAAPALASVADEADSPVQFFSDIENLLITGEYPALIFLPFALAGLVAVRSGLGRPRTQVWMMACGAVVSALGYGAALVIPGVGALAHSGTTAEILGSGGFAILVIGALLWLTAPERAGFGRTARAVSWPIGASGSMALTAYTAQILVLALLIEFEDDPGVPDYPGWPLMIGMTLATLVIASLWHYFLGKGPLERALAYATREPVTRVRARAHARATARTDVARGAEPES